VSAASDPSRLVPMLPLAPTTTTRIGGHYPAVPGSNQRHRD
jgi:hypothetical protein